MTGRLRKRLARRLAALAAALLPGRLRPWGVAMQYETAAIEKPGAALAFAAGSLFFAVKCALGPQALSLIWGRARGHHRTASTESAMFTDWSRRHDPRASIALCAILATALGLVYMAMAGAPLSYLAMNAGALATGFVMAGAFGAVARSFPTPVGGVNLLLGVALLLTGLTGVAVAGATRWVAVGSLFVQTSLLVVPVLAVGFARTRDPLSAAGIVAAAMALALQPDRGMAGALALATLALAVTRPERTVLIAAVSAVSAFAVTLMRPDALPAMPYVDQILYTSFGVHPLAGIAVLTGVALMIVPAILGLMADQERSPVHVVFAAVWIGVVAAAALGNYPTPVVGYGGSAIIGYVISLLAFPPRKAWGMPVASDDRNVTGSGDEERHRLRRLGYSF